MKIGAIRLHSRFYTPRESERIGFEIGADIFAELDMDMVLIYDKDKSAIERFYANLLCRHLKLAQTIAIDGDSLAWLNKICFSSEKVFSELVRAAEGVPRDFLHLFHQAYVVAFRSRSKQNKINAANVQKAAERWYIDDKLDAIWENPNLSKLLQGIVDEVLQGKRARMFIIEQELSRHPLIQSLIEARLLHVVRRGWSHSEKRGVRYDIISIDFGAYASRINTLSAPQIELFPAGTRPSDHELVDESDLLVPFDDDMRAIRRVEVTRAFLAKFEFMQQEMSGIKKENGV